MARPSAAQMSVANALLAAVADEMGAVLGRTALSPNIKERRDYSCAVFDPQGRLVAQAAHIPVHLGAMPEAVRAVLPLAPFRPGDLIALNDPYLGGTHLPDITLVSPVFHRRSLIGFVASRAHHADVGGMAPGSMPLARDIWQEGIIIPPLRLAAAGRLQKDVLALLLRNVRTPEERRGDLEAQIAAQRIGEERLQELARRLGRNRLLHLMTALQEYAERMTRAAIARIPDGRYSFQDYMDDDGLSDEHLVIQATVTVTGDVMHVDFTGTAPQRPSSINAVAAVTRSAIYYVVRCLLEEGVPANEGCFRPITITLPEGTLVNARPPAAVSAGNVETSQRIVDVVLGALAQALPHLIPAASQGTMNNIAMGGWDHRRGRPFAYYETIGGGAGAGPRGPGLDAVHTHMTNTMNTPIEALEMAYPLRICEYRVRRGSGGPGRHRGGDGIVRTYQFLCPTTVTIISERRRLAPWGLQGGSPGQPGRNTLIRNHGEVVPLPSKCQIDALPGDRLVIETPGGGGWGSL